MEEQSVRTKKKTIGFKIGIFLLILYPVCWLVAAGVPFITLSLKMKAILIPSLLIGAEILFLIGAALVGKDVVMKMKDKWLLKHRRKNKE